MVVDKKKTTAVAVPAAVVAFDKHLEQAFVRLAAEKNPIRRAQAAGIIAERLRSESARFGEVRTEALIELRESGWSLADMSAEFGIARARLSQIINRSEYRQYRRDVMRRR